MTVVHEIDFEDALEIYFEHFERQPADGESCRNADETGWEIRNSYGLLAVVSDSGEILTDLR